MSAKQKIEPSPFFPFTTMRWRRIALLGTKLAAGRDASSRLLGTMPVADRPLMPRTDPADRVFVVRLPATVDGGAARAAAAVVRDDDAVSIVLTRAIVVRHPYVGRVLHRLDGELKPRTWRLTTELFKEPPKRVRRTDLHGLIREKQIDPPRLEAGPLAKRWIIQPC